MCVFTGTFIVFFVVAVRHGRVVGIPTSDSEGLGFTSRSGRSHTQIALRAYQRAWNSTLTNKGPIFATHFNVTFHTIILPHDARVEPVHLPRVVC